jgi:uncharacterized protein YrrD
MISNVVTADTLIGMTVLSRATGNKLGAVQDLYIDPIEGQLKGVTIQTPDGKFAGIDYKNIYSFGQDAVMANDDDAIVPIKEDWVESHSHAKKHLFGVKIVTESGNALGQVANIYVRLSPPPFAIYEVRDSILDKLLGRSFFIFASAGRALSENAERIVVPDDTTKSAAATLAELMNRVNAPIQHKALIVQTPDDGEEAIVRQ